MQITKYISTYNTAASLGAFFISFSFSIKRQADPRDDNLPWIRFLSPGFRCEGRGGNMLQLARVTIMHNNTFKMADHF